MEYARPPPNLSNEGPMDVNWRNWCQQFLIFLKASGSINKPNDAKANLLLNLIGPVGVQAYGDFVFDSPNDKEDMDLLIEKFNNCFAAKVTQTHERYIFFSSARQNNETIDQYVNTLKVKAKTCDFGDLLDTLIRDKIILDVKNKKLRKHLLGDPNLTLKRTVDVWKEFENIEKLKQLCSPTRGPDTVNAQDFKSSSGKSDATSCTRCGTRKHDAMKDCPAWGKKCENCGMLNHLAQSCNKPATSLKDLGAQNKTITPSHFNPGPFTQIPKPSKKV